jgi:hypothetical protein
MKGNGPDGAAPSRQDLQETSPTRLLGHIQSVGNGHPSNKMRGPKKEPKMEEKDRKAAIGKCEYE